MLCFDILRRPLLQICCYKYKNIESSHYEVVPFICVKLLYYIDLVILILIDLIHGCYE